MPLICFAGRHRIFGELITIIQPRVRGHLLDSQSKKFLRSPPSLTKITKSGPSRPLTESETTPQEALATLAESERASVPAAATSPTVREAGGRDEAVLQGLSY